MPYKFNAEHISPFIIKPNTIKMFKTRVFILVFFLFFTINTIAQVPPPGGGGVNDEALPISSFVTIGLIAGAAYGIRKLR